MQSTDNLTREAHLQRRVALVPAPDWHIRRMLAWSPTRDVARNSKAPGKRTQNCWPTTPNIVVCYMLRSFAHPGSVACCCLLLGILAQSLKPVKLLSQWLPTFQTIPINYTEVHVPRYGQYPTHAHNHITRTVAGWQPWTAVSPLLELRAKQMFMAANPRVILVVRMLKVLAIP